MKIEIRSETVDNFFNELLKELPKFGLKIQETPDIGEYGVIIEKEENTEKQTAKSFTDWIIGNNIEYLDLDEDTRDWYYKRFKKTYQK